MTFVHCVLVLVPEKVKAATLQNCPPIVNAFAGIESTSVWTTDVNPDDVAVTEAVVEKLSVSVCPLELQAQFQLTLPLTTGGTSVMGTFAEEEPVVEIPKAVPVTVKVFW